MWGAIQDTTTKWRSPSCSHFIRVLSRLSGRRSNRDYFQIFKNLHSKIDSVTLWGLADDTSWLNPGSNKAGCAGVTAADAPLPWDSYLQHKFAYTGMINPLQLPGANLVTTVSASSGTVGSGKLITFVATVDNQGPNDAVNLTFTAATPPTTLLNSFVGSSGWSCTVPAFMTAGTVTCSATGLTNGASAQFTMTVRTSCPTPPGSPLTDTATVTSTT